MTYEPIKSTPRVRVYRTPDKGQYIFMELAEVDPGHCVAYGELRKMEPAEAQANAMTFVVNSVLTFFSRDGLDKNRRLNIKPHAALISVCDLLDVELVSESALGLIPYRRGEVQNTRLKDLQIDLPLDAPSEIFFEALEKSFSAVRKANKGAAHPRSS